LARRGEDYPVTALEKINIVDISPLNYIFKNIKDKAEQVGNRELNSAWILLIGKYGSGKTILLRYFAHQLVNEKENIIPIYYLLSKPDHATLFKRIKSLIDEIEKYISNPKLTAPTLYGKPDGWIKGEKLKVLKDAIKEVEEKQQTSSEFEKFIGVMRVLNMKDYIPVLIFDEFERLIYTGEGLTTDEALLTFKDMVTNFLSLTRGHLFNGVGILASTARIKDLFEISVKGGYTHIGKLSQIMRLQIVSSNLDSLAGVLTMISPNIEYSSELVIKWYYKDLKKFNDVYNLGVPDDIIQLLSKVYPTPRALCRIYEELKYRNVKFESKEEKIQGTEKKVWDIFYEIIEGRLNELLGGLVNFKLDNKPLLYRKAEWDKHLINLCKKGYYVIKWEEMEKIAEDIELKGKSTKISKKERLRNILNKLYQLGIYEKIEKGTYALNSYLFAYLIGVERLITGEEAKLENIIEIIKEKVKELREKRKERQKKSVTKKETGATFRGNGKSDK
jgi:hypothetical protein